MNYNNLITTYCPKLKKSGLVEHITLEQAINKIKDPTWEKLTNNIRNATTKSIAKQLKERLPLVVFNGMFNHRSEAGLEQANGLITIDIDEDKESNSLTIEQCDKLQPQLEADPHTVLLFRSPSGKFKLLFYNEQVQSGREIKIALQQINKYLINKYEVKVDEATLNNEGEICRGAFIAYNKNPYFNSEAQQFDINFEEHTAQNNTNKEKNYSENNSEKGVIIDKIRCPFHDDHNPSMTIYEEGNGFCFSCKASATKEALEKPSEANSKPNKQGGKHYFCIDERFKQENLLENIYNELNKKHVLDDKEKLSLFLIATTAELKNPNDRCSVALKGDSSAGKDNAVKTVFDLFDEKECFFLTSGTQSSLERGVEKAKRVAFSEINANREKGANKDLTEVFKQLSEGGVHAIKTNKITHEVEHFKQEQKSLFYGTTESESDEELETRYIIIPIKGYERKNRTVVHSYMDTLSSIEAIKNKNKPVSWIKQGIKNLNHNVEIVMPYIDLLKIKIKDTDGKYKELFDFKKERVKRDAKRLFCITKAITWLHQLQRHQITETDGVTYVFSEPQDFLVALQLFAEFFNLTYSGMDFRVQKVLEAIKEHEKKHDDYILKCGFPNKYVGWVPRHLIQEELGISKQSTMKKRIDVLKDLELIETFYDRTINPKAYLLKYSGYQLGTNRVSLAINWQSLVAHLAPYRQPEKREKIYGGKTPPSLSLEFLGIEKNQPQESCVKTEIGTHKISTLKTPRYTEEDVEIPSVSDFLSNNTTFHADDFISLYDEQALQKLASAGDIVEKRSGFYEVLR